VQDGTGKRQDAALLRGYISAAMIAGWRGDAVGLRRHDDGRRAALDVWMLVTHDQHVVCCTDGRGEQSSRSNMRTEILLIEDCARRDTSAAELPFFRRTEWQGLHHAIRPQTQTGTESGGRPLRYKPKHSQNTDSTKGGAVLFQVQVSFVTRLNPKPRSSPARGNPFKSRASPVFQKCKTPAQ